MFRNWWRSSVTEGHRNRLTKHRQSCTLRLETLEDRSLPSIALRVGPNIDISQLKNNENEPAIAVDPNNPAREFAVSNTEATGTSGGLFGAFSTDGGLSWSGRLLGTGTGGDGLPAACCDPQVAFDNFGNLFVTYLGNDLNPHVLLSTDGGQSFSNLNQPSTTGTNDQPKVAIGGDSIWVSYFDGSGQSASGATITGLGSVGPFTSPQSVPGSANGNFGGLAVGPAGQVLLVYQNATTTTGPDIIMGNLNPGGVGGTFGNNFMITDTNVGGADLSLPAVSNSLGIDAEAKVAWDRSSGPHAGRVYITYTDVGIVGDIKTNIYERFSDDSGLTWSNRVQVTDNSGDNSKFLPAPAVDQATGDLGVMWWDTRNDTGNGPPGDTNGIPNDDAEIFATFSLDGGQTFLPNVQVGAASNAADSEPAASGLRDLGFGDYQVTNGFVDGVFHPIWADNSDVTNNNPDGRLSKLDLYTATVSLAVTSQPTFAVGAQFGGPPIVNVYDSATKALKFSFMAYMPTFLGGVRVAMADVNGDSVPDIITAPGPGGSPDIRVFDGNTGQMINEFMAYDFFFRGGVNVAAGDVFNTGVTDIITAPDAGGGPLVRVFSSADNALLRQFWAYRPSDYMGVHVAAGDLNGDGFTDVITAPGTGGSPLVEAFSGKDNSLLHAFFAYMPEFLGGVTVATGDINNSGHADIVTGAGPGGGPQVSIFDGISGQQVATFMAGVAGSLFFDDGPMFRSGVTVATTDVNSNGLAQIIVGSGPGNGPVVKFFDPNSLAEVFAFEAFSPSQTNGVYVGGV
jgi:hypothetical protein